MRTNPHLKYINVQRRKNGGVAIYFRRGGENRVRLPDFSARGFMAAYKAALESNPIPHVRDMPKTIRRVRIDKTEKSLIRSVWGAKTRARKKGVPFSLTCEMLCAMAEQQDYRCAITGIEFFAECPHSKGRATAYAPSIDRIDPKLGYVQGNVRLTVFAVNTMMLDWGEDVFSQVAKSYRYWSAKKGRPIGQPSSEVGLST